MIEKITLIVKLTFKLSQHFGILIILSNLVTGDG